MMDFIFVFKFPLRKEPSSVIHKKFKQIQSFQTHFGVLTKKNTSSYFFILSKNTPFSKSFTGTRRKNGRDFELFYQRDQKTQYFPMYFCVRKINEMRYKNVFKVFNGQSNGFKLIFFKSLLSLKMITKPISF